MINIIMIYFLKINAPIFMLFIKHKKCLYIEGTAYFFTDILRRSIEVSSYVQDPDSVRIPGVRCLPVS